MYKKEFEFLKNSKEYIKDNKLSKLYNLSRKEDLNIKPIFDKIKVDLIPKLNKFDFKIDDITLLSVKEAERVPEDIRKFYRLWWLRSPGGNGRYAAAVYDDGSVDHYGYIVFYDSIAARPALKIRNLESFNLKLGDLVEVCKIEWVYIGMSMLLCNDDSFGKHRFDEKSDDYEKSEIKRYIHEKAVEFGII